MKATDKSAAFHGAVGAVLMPQGGGCHSAVSRLPLTLTVATLVRTLRQESSYARCQGQR